MIKKNFEIELPKHEPESEKNMLKGEFYIKLVYDDGEEKEISKINLGDFVGSISFDMVNSIYEKLKM